MRYTLYGMLGALVAFWIFITVYPQKPEVLDPIVLKQDEMNSSVLSHDEYYGNNGETTLEEIDTPYVKPRASSSESSESSEPPERRFRAKFTPHFQVIHVESSSSISSAQYSASSSSSVSPYCADDSYLDHYTDQGSKEAAKRARNKLCR